MSYTIQATLTIYGYAKQGTIVYVGQTRNSLVNRDNAHRNYNITKFDTDYGQHRNEYGPPFVIEESKRSETVSNDLMHATVLDSWQTWMNDREIWWIATHQTYSSPTGLNFTRGGQMGCDVAFFQAQLKRSEDKWTTVYMPLFRTIELGMTRNLWQTPADHVESGVKLGHILNNVRTGHTLLPPKYVAEMAELGFEKEKSYYECLFERTILPAIRSTSFAQSGRLWDMPSTYEVSGIKIGLFLCSVRTGKGSISSVHTAEMKSFGFDQTTTYTQKKWVVDYMPAFRDSPYAQKKRLWEMPRTYVVKGINLGDVLCTVRSGKSSLPEEHIDEMLSMGFDPKLSVSLSRFKIDTMPAIRDCLYGRECRLSEMPHNYKYHNVQVGYNIRGRKRAIDPSYLEELKSLGYKRERLN
jgi:hypothetical protein